MTTEEIIAALATAQFGVFSYKQAIQRGITPAQLRSRVLSGALVRVYPKVFAISGLPLDHRSRVAAAVLWSGNGVASHRTAARWHRLDGIRPSPIEISSLKSTSSPGDFIVHRPTRLPDWQITQIDGVNVTTLERTLLDLCAVGKPWECSDAIDSAFRREANLLERLDHILKVESKPGRTGMRLLRALVAERDASKAPPGSVLAGRFLRWLRVEGFPEPVAEFEIRGEFGFVKRLDFAYLAERIGFEVDGYGTHGNMNAFDGDREADDILLGLGWRIFRVTNRLMNHQMKMIRFRNSVNAALQHQVSARSTSPDDAKRAES